MTTTEITRWADGGVHVVRVTGEFDLGACPAFRAESAEPARELLVVDLRQTTFLDSHALGALIELNNRAQSAGFRLAIMRPDGHANRIFSVTGTDGSLPLYDPRVPVLAQMNYG